MNDNGNKKCPFCGQTFELLGGSLQTRHNEIEWNTTLFHHLYWNHEKDLTT